MKTLILRRSSIKGPDGAASPEGLELARREGKRALKKNIGFSKLFHGQLIRTAQTALAFFEGQPVPKVMPVVNGLGDEALLKAMANPGFKIGIQHGLSNFEALICAHHDDGVVARWVKASRQAVVSMFEQMPDGETAIGFGHSPLIELAAFACEAEHSDVEDWKKLNDLEGLIFVCEGEGEIRIIGKIRVRQSAMA